jgi:hypothetical protein
MTNSTVRRSGRIPREIPILLIGSDMEGTVFSEETKTVMISLHGAGIVSTQTRPMFALFTEAWCAIAATVNSPPCGNAAPGYPPEAPR